MIMNEQAHHIMGWGLGVLLANAADGEKYTLSSTYRITVLATIGYQMAAIGATGPEVAFTCPT